MKPIVKSNMAHRYNRQWYLDNREKTIARSTLWRKQHLDRNRVSALKCYYAHREERNNQRLVKRYGIDITQYNVLLQEQNNKCAMCDRDKGLFKTKLCVDHDHKTGKIRGLLCRSCNALIGRFERKGIFKILKYLGEPN